ncbi:MerR family transcriptional regulator [Alicyclobacillus fastidiosus]|uniref:MerR family transcriptional regulator n=1 Tax=Alicyclobacillus fastidiosus TaxID=392011 RepID=A0ABV5AGK0_9BACL|nr:MerR family transcriptional regulator [Alicyclobacillus fastidiosus]WEH07971.1 MerR family transcriptional regulator [Alicyclobacillus fastidiosus]
MLYTVKEVSDLSNVTVKTLHHYHKIGLLPPCEVSEAGYRLYSMKELERLQEILFYRELDFPLVQIKQLLENKPDRSTILTNQKELLVARKRRLKRLIETIDESIDSVKKGAYMDTGEMFKGFANEDEWRKALKEQNEYLRKQYGHDLLADENAINVEQMNQQANEAARFMKGMANALSEGIRHDDPKVQSLIGRHLDFLNQQGHTTSPSEFVARTRFFLSDDFHRQMLESQQTGLAYYLCVAAQSFAQ